MARTVVMDLGEPRWVLRTESGQKECKDCDNFGEFNVANRDYVFCLKPCECPSRQMKEA